MTVSSSTNKIIGSGNGVTTSWPFSFKCFDEDHLVVTYTDTAGDETTLSQSDYTVSLNSDQDASPGGTVTYSPAIASGTKLTILRVVPYVQATDIKNQSGFFPEVLERSDDLIVMQIQQLYEQLSRTLKLSPSQSAIGELQATDDARAGLLVGFDSEGNPALLSGGSDSPVSAPMQAVVAAASIAAARTLLGLGSFAVMSPPLANANLANMTGFSLKGQLLGSGAAVPVDLTQAQALAGLVSFVQPGHRLSLATGEAVTVADQTAKGTIFWTPRWHNLAPVWNGSAWINMTVSELSLALDSDTGHTGYHQLGFNFDAFLDYNAGTPRLVTGPKWTNDTTRADAISRDAAHGRYVNSASIVVRFGTASGNTATKGAGTLLYLGTFRCTANGQTEDSYAARFVWNMYNRVQRVMNMTESTDTWSYSTATIRQARANTANKLEFVRGLDVDAASCRVVSQWSNNTVGQGGRVGPGLDSTTAFASGASLVGMLAHAVNQPSVSMGQWVGLPGLGYHYLSWNEQGTGSGTQTWSGDGGSPSNTQSSIQAEVMA